MSSHQPLFVNRDGGWVLVFDSATHLESYVAEHAGEAGALVVAGSYAGVFCARMVMSTKSRAAIRLDCAIGKDDSGRSALELVEEDGIAGASVSALSTRTGDGQSTYFDSLTSAANSVAMLKSSGSVRAHAKRKNICSADRRNAFHSQ